MNRSEGVKIENVVLLMHCGNIFNSDDKNSSYSLRRVCAEFLLCLIVDFYVNF